MGALVTKRNGAAADAAAVKTNGQVITLTGIVVTLFSPINQSGN